MPNQVAEHWTLDKKIPAALILAVALNFFGTAGVGIWYVAKTDAQNDEQDRRISKVEEVSNGNIKLIQVVNERLARIEEKTGSLVDILREMRNDMRRR